MNRIYKVIYSKARQCYIVVSELAKSNHKSSQQGADHTNTPALARIIAVALAAGALTWGSVPAVSWAADETDTGNNTHPANPATVEYAKVDASNLTSDENKNAWRIALGGGSVPENDAKLISGGDVYKGLHPVTERLSSIPM